MGFKKWVRDYKDMRARRRAVCIFSSRATLPLALDVVTVGEEILRLLGIKTAYEKRWSEALTKDKPKEVNDMLVAILVYPKDAIIAGITEFGWIGLKVDLKSLTKERRVALAGFPLSQPRGVPWEGNETQTGRAHPYGHCYKTGTPLVSAPGNIGADFSALCRILDKKA